MSPYIYIYIYSYQKKCSLVLPIFLYKDVQKCKYHNITTLFSMQKQLLYMLAHVYTLLENTEKFINLMNILSYYIYKGTNAYPHNINYVTDKHKKI